MEPVFIDRRSWKMRRGEDEFEFIARIFLREEGRLNERW
jgi:hypothetical protein